MEVSSLGVKQHRTDGLQFDVGVFTNLSPDHIGPKEHASMEEYIACKAELFAHSDYAVINLDDPVSAQMIAAAEKGNHPVCTFSLHQPSDLKAGNLAPWQSSNRLGIGFDLAFDGQTRRFAISQPGEFSVYNGLAVIAVCRRIFAMRGETLSYEPLQKALAQATVAGRIELIDLLPDATVIIDYAHNELSMESLLTTLQQYDYKRLVVVFGSVGGRSQLRRLPLGRVAAKYADFCILTADNPDFEPPKEIIAEIAQAFEGTGTPYIGIEDRAEAVRYAITHHQPGDMIVFAGKGHETYQLIRGVKEPFSEKAILLQMVQQS
jgi:UDP-N-acetylmuramoyl-L-alanyl-D-glutamate--2,6-diaminopimelate ligase